MSTEANRDVLINRIRHLLDRTTERGATSAEAATAARMATSLIAKYQISETDLKLSEGADGAVDVTVESKDVTRAEWRPRDSGRVSWESPVGRIAKAASYATSTYSWRKIGCGFNFAGAFKDALIAVEIARYLHERMERDTRVFMKTARANWIAEHGRPGTCLDVATGQLFDSKDEWLAAYGGDHYGRYYRVTEAFNARASGHSFRMGFCDGVYSAVKAEIEERIGSSHKVTPDAGRGYAMGSALVPLFRDVRRAKETAISTWVKENLKLGFRRRKGAVIKDAGAMNAGRIAGARVSVGNGANLKGGS